MNSIFTHLKNTGCFFLPLFLLIVSSAFPQSITVTNPNGGESWLTGSTQSITWTSSGSVANVKIELTTDNGQSWSVVTSSTTAAAGNYQWIVPEFAVYECKIRISSTDNSVILDATDGIFIIYPQPKTSVAPLIPVTYQTFTWPLNAYHPVTSTSDDQATNGRVGNACGQTAMTNVFYYWQFPRKGTGTRTFTDDRGCTWSADFGQTIYNYDRMLNPLPANATQDQYDAIATLMYHAGTGMHDTWRTGAKEGFLNAVKTYFNYSQKAKFLNRVNYSPEQWDKVFKTELSLGRPIIIGGDGGPLPEGGVAGHWFICDGYNSDSKYHIQMNYGGIQGYYPLYEFVPYHVNNNALIYFEPELNGKKLLVTSPGASENWQQGTSKTISWTSIGVTNIQIEYSTNSGWDWQTITSSTAASAGSYSFTVPAVISENCLIRITDADNINVYDKCDKEFRIYDTQELTMQFSLFQKIQAGVTLPVRWSFKGIENVVIEYSSNGGSSWNSIVKKPASDKGYFWQIPQIISQGMKVRIYSETEPNLKSESNQFSVVASPVAGGPYVNDANTVVLLHFDKNYENASNQNSAANPTRLISYSDNINMGLDYSARIDNSTEAASCIVIPQDNSFNLTDNWTIETWFKIRSWGSGTVAYPYLFFKADFNYYITLSPQSNTLTAGYDYEGGSERINLPGNSIQLDNWYHVTFIRNTSNHSLRCVLRNSSRDIIADVSGNYNPIHIPKSSSADINIGGIGGLGNIQFDGWVDEIRISNTAREVTVANENEKESLHIPVDYSLMQNYPNPFNPVTTIKYSIPKTSYVSVKIYDVLGKEIMTLVNEEKAAGNYSVEFGRQNKNLSSGVYFYKLQAGEYLQTRKMVLLK
jgi:hypothetical protein